MTPNRFFCYAAFPSLGCLNVFAARYLLQAGLDWKMALFLLVSLNLAIVIAILRLGATK